MLPGIEYFKALADTTRLRILLMLLNQELNVNELVAALDMGQSRVSRHLKILTDAGLLQVRRDGLWSFYSISTHDAERRFINAIIYLWEQDPQFLSDQQITRQIIQERKAATTHFFNTVAGDWEKIKYALLGDFPLNEVIKEHIPIANTIADLGCGTGDLLMVLSDRAQCLIGVDSSPQMLEKVRARFLSKRPVGIIENNNVLAGQIELRLGEVEHLPLIEAETDYVVLNLVLHHLSMPVLALKEAYRVLKPAGCLVVTDFEQHRLETLRQSYGDRWLGFPSAQLTCWLKEAGFSLLKQERFQLDQDLSLLFYLVKKEAPAAGS